MALALLFILGALQGATVEPDISLSLACGPSDSTVSLTLRNPTEANTAVLLGIVLANGQWYLPREIVAELTREGSADTETLVFGGPRNIAGPMDHWVVALPMRSAFTLTLSANDFISTSAVQASSAPEQLRVRLTGKSITSDLNVDMTGMKSWRLWNGTATSNTIRLSECRK
jgi:hypothetical protein